MKLTKAVDFPFSHLKHQNLPAKWLNDCLSKVLKVLALIVEPDPATGCKTCQLQLLMVGLILCRQQVSLCFCKILRKIKVLRRKHNSFWQSGAGLASLDQQKGLFLYTSANKETDWNGLTT